MENHMNAYIIELRDSDGNDVTVYDVVVSAATRDEALDAMWAHIVVVANMSARAVDAYHASRDPNAVYLYFRRSTEHAHGELRYAPDREWSGIDAEWELADPRPERGFTPRAALVARTIELARRLPILAWGDVT